MLTDLIVIEPVNHTILRRLWCDYVERLYLRPVFVGDVTTQRAVIQQLQALGKQLGFSFWLFVKKNATPGEYSELRIIARGS